MDAGRGGRMSTSRGCFGSLTSAMVVPVVLVDVPDIGVVAIHDDLPAAHAIEVTHFPNAVGLAHLSLLPRLVRGAQPRPSQLLRLDVGEFHHLGPFGHVVSDILTEVSRGADEHRASEAGELRPQCEVGCGSR